MQFFSNSGQSGYVADVSGDLTLQAEANSALVLSGGTNGIKWSGAAYFEDGGSYSNTTNTNKVVRATANGKPYWEMFLQMQVLQLYRKVAMYYLFLVIQVL